jgi:hypothetical protein
MNWNFYNTDIINDATVFSKKISDERNKRWDAETVNFYHT